MGHASFKAIYADATVGLMAYKQTAAHALTIGIRPNDLIRFVRGDLEGIARTEVQASLDRSPWALGRVVALVKARRNASSLGSRIVASDLFDPYAWGILNTGDIDTDGCTLLDLL